MRTQVGIIGAGPSGLLLARLLALQGIESVIIERQSKEHVLGRIRAGVLEEGMARLLREAQVGARMDEEGLVHGGIHLAFSGRMERIDLAAHTDGKVVMIYGQTEVTKDLVEAHLAAGGIIHYESPALAVEDYTTDQPRIIYEQNGQRQELICDFVAGCDGYHGIARKSVPAAKISLFEKTYPFGWLGILSDVPPVEEEIIYANHERGFALCSLRSHTRSRYYIQCPIDIDLADWPDERVWDELAIRLGPQAAANMKRAPAIEKSVAPLRSFVAEPMRHGRLFLAGDAAHIVPPTGAKGLNLASADVLALARALTAQIREGTSTLIDTYSANRLAEIWKVERFSWWMTMLLHRFSDREDFNARIQMAELDYLAGSRAAQLALAENYVGLPLAG